MIPLPIRLIPLLIATQSLGATELDPFDAFDAQLQSSFQAIDSDLSSEYEMINAAINSGFQQLSKEVESVWGQGEIRLPEKHIWVDYSDDKSTRRIFDFASESLTVEHLVDPNASFESTSATIKEAVYEAKTDTTTDLAVKDDALKYAMNSLAKSGIDLTASSVRGDLAREPILGDNLLISKKTVDAIDAIAKEQTDGATQIKRTDDSRMKSAVSPIKSGVQQDATESRRSTQLSSKLTKGGKRKISVTIPLEPDFMITRSKEFRTAVLEQADRHNLQPSLIFAIMETESHFNPRARSPIPAFGLMQLVPSSGGVDSYNYLYGTKKILPPEYFFQADQNIELGTAYIKLLNHNYLKSIKNPISRIYCTVAAYNAGAGGVARAFVGNKNVDKASAIINEMTSSEVYDHLLEYLPATETKNYLTKVFKAQARYRFEDLAK